MLLITQFYLTLSENGRNESSKRVVKIKGFMIYNRVGPKALNFQYLVVIRKHNFGFCKTIDFKVHGCMVYIE